MTSMTALLRRLPAALLTITILALLALVARSWLASHDAAIQLAATLAEQKKTLDQDATQEKQRDAAVAKTVAAITQTKHNVRTPADVIEQIPQILPPLPAPVTITLPEPTAATPEPAAVATVPQTDLKPLYDYVQDCRVCQANLSAAQGDLADERSKVTALTKERDAAVQASKGGGFWSRVKRGATWFAIGSAAAALALETTRR